jgi:class 3 adenylate cyclase
LTERNAALASDQQIAFRVGINVGDIIIDGDDIFGDGVNLAARLQALAEPGEICDSKVVRDQVVDKLNFAFEDLGERRVKNIPRPVEVFRVRLGTEPNAPSRRRWLRPGRSGRWLWLVAGVAALGIAVLFGVRAICRRLDSQSDVPTWS